MTEPDLQILLHEGIAAAKAAQQEPESPEKPPQKRIYRLGTAKVSQRERARQILLRVTELDETNILAWLWLSTVLDDVEQQKVCLENVLTLDPTHKAAMAGLAQLDQLARLPKPEPKPVQPAKPPSQDKAIPQPASFPLALKSQYHPGQTGPPKSSGIACPFCQQATSAGHNLFLLPASPGHELPHLWRGSRYRAKNMLTVQSRHGQLSPRGNLLHQTGCGLSGTRAVPRYPKSLAGGRNPQP